MDSNVIVASFLVSEARHDIARQYINGLENGDYVFHLPMLVVVEVTSVIARRALKNRVAFLTTWQQNILDWEQDGKLLLYPLDRDRMDRALTIAQRDRLKGPDSVIAALAEELDMPVRTFDGEILERFLRASV